MVRHLAGVAEIVEDVPAAVAFYRDTLGFAIKQQQGDDYVVFAVPGHSSLRRLEPLRRRRGHVRRPRGSRQHSRSASTSNLKSTTSNQTAEQIDASQCVLVQPPHDEPWGQKTTARNRAGRRADRFRRHSLGSPIVAGSPGRPRQCVKSRSRRRASQLVAGSLTPQSRRVAYPPALPHFTHSSHSSATNLNPPLPNIPPLRVPISTATQRARIDCMTTLPDHLSARALYQPRIELAGVQCARTGRSTGHKQSTPGAGEVSRHLRFEFGRVFHGPRCRASRAGIRRGAPPRPASRRPGSAHAAPAHCPADRAARRPTIRLLE